MDDVVAMTSECRAPMDQAVDAFQAGSQSFRNVLDQVAERLQAERDSLQAERDAFAEEQQRFAQETARVQQVSCSSAAATMYPNSLMIPNPRTS